MPDDGKGEEKGKKKRGSRKPGTDGGLSFLTEAVSDGTPSPTFADGTLEQVKEDAGTGQDAAEHDRSARRKDLVSQAEMRAEHQALARITMLDLARELEEAAEKRRALEKELMQERKHSDLLRERAEKAEEKTQQLEQKLEDAKVELYKFRFKDGLFRGSLTSTMLMFSQEALPLNRLSISPSQPGSPSAAMGLGPVEEICDEGSEEEQEEDEEESDLDGHDEKETQGRRCSGRPSFMRRHSVQGRKLEKGGERSKGDGLMLLWMFRAFREYSEEAKRHRLESEGKAAAEAARNQEIDKLKSSYEKLLAEERAKVRALDARVKGLIEEIERWKLKVDALEREKAELLKQLKPSEHEDLGLDELKRKYTEVLGLLEQKEREIVDLKQMIRELENKLVNQREAFEDEIRKLKAQIRDLSAELQRQILFAKHLRDLALKAKRDAASSISPEKFAQLIGDLEMMRDKLVILGSEHDREAQQANLLRMKLDQNKRRLELERQFLPLLHKVRGPVGPKNPLFNKNMAAMAAAAMVPDELGPPQDKLRMAHSQSSPALRPEPGAAGGRGGSGGHRLTGL